LDVPLKTPGRRALRVHHLALPRPREAAAHAEVEQFERVAQGRLAHEGAMRRSWRPAGGAPRPGGRSAVEAAEVQLVDDGQHEDLEGHHVHLRPRATMRSWSPSARPE
jgi:hypothetical protein